jgi:hypothetical protein
MHNGATVAGFRNSTQVFDGIIVDWNGPGGSNVIGDDQMYMAINFTQSTPYYGATRCMVTPSSNNAPSVTLYQSLYSN